MTLTVAARRDKSDPFATFIRMFLSAKPFAAHRCGMCLRGHLTTRQKSKATHLFTEEEKV